MADPQFSSPAVPRPLARAEARIDSGEDTIDPALLQASLTILSRHLTIYLPLPVQAVLADPVLLRAVDPHVLQAVLVQAATANLQLELDTSHQQLQLRRQRARHHKRDLPLSSTSSILVVISPRRRGHVHLQHRRPSQVPDERESRIGSTRGQRQRSNHQQHGL